MTDTHMSSLAVRSDQLAHRKSPEVPLGLVDQRIVRFMHGKYRLNIS
jgi:hypothetical protein